MRKKNMGLLLLIIIAAPLMLTGCLKFDIHLTINKNGTADVDIILLAVETLVTLDKDLERDLFTGKKERLAELGFAITDYTEKNLIGFKATKRLQSVEEFSTLGLAGDIGLEGRDPFSVMKGVLTSTYNLDADIDLRPLFAEHSDMFTLFSPDLRFSVTLPAKPLSHNATSVTVDGRTLTWDLSPDARNKIQFTARAPNLTAVVILLALAVVLVGAIMTVLIRRIRIIANQHSLKAKKNNR